MFQPKKRCALGATEIFLLIASAYAHDLGMIVFPGEERELAKSLSFSLDGLGNKSDPPRLSEEKSLEARRRIYCPELRKATNPDQPSRTTELDDEVTQLHNPELVKNLSEPIAAEQRVIDLRQLSIILCIADAIEFSDTRVIDGVWT